MLVHKTAAGRSPGRRTFEPEQRGGWCLWLRDDAVRRFRAAEPFAGGRVLVVGGGCSAAEIAVEVAGVAERTCISVRSGAHVIHRLLEGIPIISSDLRPAVRGGAVAVRPAVERLAGDRVRLTDATEKQFDAIIYATGYQVSLPLLAPGLVSVNGREIALYRRIVPALAPAGLSFAGCVDAPRALLSLVETRGDWIAAVLGGRLVLPPTEQMRRAITRPERRTRRRFPDETPLSIGCDPHAYRRLPRADLRRAARRTLRPRLRPGSSHPLSRCRFRVIWAPATHESGRG